MSSSKWSPKPANASEALDRVACYRPDVVVMDIRLPGKNGIEATREIIAQYPETKVIILTSYAEDDLLFDAIEAGASGYVLKQIGSRGAGDGAGKNRTRRITGGPIADAGACLRACGKRRVKPRTKHLPHSTTKS